MVADGSMQEDVPDYETSSPTPGDEMVRVCLACSKGMVRGKIAFKGAFLNAMMKKKTFLRVNRKLTAIIAKLFPELKTFVCG